MRPPRAKKQPEKPPAQSGTGFRKWWVTGKKIKAKGIARFSTDIVARSMQGAMAQYERENPTYKALSAV